MFDKYFKKNNTSNIKSKFIYLNLNYGIVHWDSKILRTLVGKEKCDRLPVVIMALKTEQLLGGGSSHFKWRKQ